MDARDLRRRRGGQGHRAHLVLDAVQRGQRLRLRADRRAGTGAGPEQRLHPVLHRHPARHRAPLHPRARRRVDEAGRRPHHQRRVAGHRPHERRLGTQADLPPRPPRGLLGHDLPHARHRRPHPRHRGARDLRGGPAHPAGAAGPRRPRGRHDGRADPRQRAHARPDDGRHLGAGQRQRADGAPRALADGRLWPRQPHRAGRRAVLALRARHARGHPRGARRHLSLRLPHRRHRRAVRVQDRADREGRRDRRRLRGQLAAAAARDQLRDGLYLRDDRVRRALRAPARLAEQRGHVPPGEGRGARGLDPEPALPRRRREPRDDGPLRAGARARRCTA